MAALTIALRAVTLSFGAAITAIAATGLPISSAAPGHRAGADVSASRPARGRAVCGSQRLLRGPGSPPPGAVVVGSGEDTIAALHAPHTTYWFAPGIHTFGAGAFTHITPHAGDTYLGAPGAILNGRHVNRYAFTGHATGVVIEYLTIEHFGAAGANPTQGVVNHTSASGWKIEHDTIAHNGGAGVMLGSGDVLHDDCLTANGQYGFSAYNRAGVSHLTLTGNEISYNDTYNWTKARPGCGCSGGGKFWDTNGAVVTDNLVLGNRGVGIWVDTDNRGFLISRNDIAHNSGEAITYEISYNAVISDNTIVDNGWGKGPSVPGFPIGAIYISESGGDARVRSAFAGVLRVTGNVLRTNWGGVVLWENANRFCGDTTDGLCTLVTPATYTVTSCRSHLASARPKRRPDYFDNCRWKTKTVTVTHNDFTYSPSHIARCSMKTWCGFNGLFSEYGSTAPWKGWVVPLHMSDHQHDHFRANTYQGPWHFDGFAQGDAISWTEWTRGFADPHGSGDRFDAQDARSTLRR